MMMIEDIYIYIYIKVASLHNYLSTTSYKQIWDWRYITTILQLGTRWK
jgi:hypothetical protein